MASQNNGKRGGRKTPFAERIYARLPLIDEKNFDEPLGLIEEALAAGSDAAPVAVGGRLDGVDLALLEVFAWAFLAERIDKLAEAQEVSPHPGIVRFVKALAELVEWHGPDKGADGVFGAIARGFAAQAGQAARAKGDDTRQDVKDAWQALERKGVPVRARVKQIAADEGRSATQVRTALRELGLYAPKERKRG